MSETHKYYWLKLKRDFFKRHDIVIIEAMPNGKDYILFYLKLLCESVDHEGNLRFSETIPYSEDMLATITRTNIDIVRSAVKIFSELGMMERFDDGTLFMDQVAGMIGSETNDAIRMRIAREEKKQLLIGKENGEQCSEAFKNRSPELDIELEKELDIEKEKENIPIFEAPKIDKFSRIESARAIWNEVMPNKPYRYTALNMGEQVRSECLRPMSVYSDDEIGEAIRNYARILASPEHEVKSPYESFHGFMRNGVEKYDSAADPFGAYRKRAPPESFEDKARREALAHLASLGGSSE